VFWIPGYPGPPVPRPLQRPSFGLGAKRRAKTNKEDPHEEAPHEENDDKIAKDQKTSSQVFLVRGRIKSVPAQHVLVLSKKIRSEDGVPSTLPRQGGDQLLPCLHKAARWLLTTP
jgi:hypothetical protein